MVVGRLGAPFGVRGEVKCRPAGFGPEAFAVGMSYRVGNGAGARTLLCTGVRRQRDTLLVAFAGIASPEDARALTNSELYAVAHDVPVGAGEYLDRDLVGCELVDGAGNALGCVVDVAHFPAQDCLVVGAQRALVPLVRAFVRNVDVREREIVVDLPEGLLES